MRCLFLFHGKVKWVQLQRIRPELVLKKAGEKGQKLAKSPKNPGNVQQILGIGQKLLQDGGKVQAKIGGGAQLCPRIFHQTRRIMRSTFLILAINFSLWPPLSQGQNLVDLTTLSQGKTTHSCTTATKCCLQDSLKIDLSAGQHPPQFAAWDLYLHDKIVYPQLAQEYAIEGRVSVMVYVSEKGEVYKARILKGLGFGCDEAALKLIYDMPPWTPASNYGIPVKGKKILDITFKLIK